MQKAFQLKKYLQRIGYSGIPKPDLESLRKLQQHQVRHIPFENFDPLLGLEVRLDLESLQKKMVDGMRGGYCFENNLLFLAALNQIGFKARGITGRVIYRQPANHINRRTHMLVLVDLEGVAYICDTGFGSSVLPSPIKLESQESQSTSHENYRILPYEDCLLLQMEIKGEWLNLYKFYLQKQYKVDYELGNYYTSTHPNSHFTTDLSVALVGDKKRMAMRNNRLTIHHLNGLTKKEELTSVKEILRVLEGIFHIIPPKTPHLEHTLENLLKK